MNRRVLAIAALLLGAIALSLAGGAILFYPLYLSVGGLMGDEFVKLVNLGAKMVAVPVFVCLLYRLGTFDRQALGYGMARPAFLRDVKVGWLAGVGILGVLGILLMLSGARSPNRLPMDVAAKLWQIFTDGLLAGVAIAVVEETFFRGALYAALRRNGSAWIAVVVTSLIYAIMHFLWSQPLPPGTVIGPLTGFSILAAELQATLDLGLLDSFSALFFVGLLLAIIRERTGSIAYGIGMHAGWVFMIMALRKFTQVDRRSPAQVLVGEYDGVTGWLAVPLLIALCFAYYLWFRHPPKPLPDPHDTPV